MTRKEALISLPKMIEGTTALLNMELKMTQEKGEKVPTPVITDGDNEYLLFEGERGAVKIDLLPHAVEVFCRKGDTEGFTLENQILFEYSDDSWDAKESRSAANFVSETIADYFDSEFVPASESQETVAKIEKGEEKPLPEKPASDVKKKIKKKGVNYKAVTLALRMEAIYPEIKGEVDKMIDRYGVFLPEEYFETYATPLVVKSIKAEDRQTLKKVFKAFNKFYSEGTSDVQSLIVVSILGLSITKDDSLLKKCKNYMNEALQPAVISLVNYLGKHHPDKYIEEYNNPGPYKPTRKDRKKNEPLISNS